MAADRWLGDGPRNLSHLALGWLDRQTVDLTKDGLVGGRVTENMQLLNPQWTDLLRLITSGSTESVSLRRIWMAVRWKSRWSSVPKHVNIVLDLHAWKCPTRQPGRQPTPPSGWRVKLKRNGSNLSSTWPIIDKSVPRHSIKLCQATNSHISFCPPTVKQCARQPPRLLLQS